MDLRSQEKEIMIKMFWQLIGSAYRTTVTKQSDNPQKKESLTFRTNRGRWITNQLVVNRPDGSRRFLGRQRACTVYTETNSLFGLHRSNRGLHSDLAEFLSRMPLTSQSCSFPWEQHWALLPGVWGIAGPTMIQAWNVRVSSHFNSTISLFKPLVQGWLVYVQSYNTDEINDCHMVNV